MIGSGSCFGDLGVLNGVRPNVIMNRPVSLVPHLRQDGENSENKA